MSDSNGNLSHLTGPAKASELNPAGGSTPIKHLSLKEGSESFVPTFPLSPRVVTSPSSTPKRVNVPTRFSEFDDGKLPEKSTPKNVIDQAQQDKLLNTSSSKHERRKSPYRAPASVSLLPPARFHRHFVLVFNRPLPPQINLNDLTFGRIDLIARSISSALFLSHGTRSNTKVWVVFTRGIAGESDIEAEPFILSISGDEARHARPDERNIAQLLKLTIYPQSPSVRRKSTHYLKGLRVIHGNLEDCLTFALSSHPKSDLVYLSETLGANNCILGNPRYSDNSCSSVNGDVAIVVVLGDDRGLTEDQEDMVMEQFQARPLSLGPMTLTGSDCIVIAHHYLDSGCMLHCLPADTRDEEIGKDQKQKKWNGSGSGHMTPPNISVGNAVGSNPAYSSLKDKLPMPFNVSPDNEAKSTNKISSSSSDVVDRPPALSRFEPKFLLKPCQYRREIKACCDMRRTKANQKRSRFIRPPNLEELALYREAFEMLDTDGSGLIEMSEIKDAFAALHTRKKKGSGSNIQLGSSTNSLKALSSSSVSTGSQSSNDSRPTSPTPTAGPTEMELEFLLKCVNPSGECVISLDEFIDLVREERGWEEEEYLARAFKAMDKENKGFITAQQLKGIMEEQGEILTDAEVQVMIDQADSVGDGKVRFKDFVALLRY